MAGDLDFHDEFAASHMGRAIELAARGQGFVEPNPMVGCVIVANGQIIGEGWHEKLGSAHAEVGALAQAGQRARGATLYCNLEPCCHHGKTPPCTDAILKAGIARVVVAQQDPFPQVAGQGIAQLKAAGIAVEVGLLEAAARELNAPFHKLIMRGRPFTIAKWAMTLDGQLAASSGDSRWISSEASRAVVHQLRGRVDAILVGRGTALTDDPLLLARPSGARVATRIVADSLAALPSESQSARTAAQGPVIVAVSSAAPTDRRAALVGAGCEVLECAGDTAQQRLEWLLDELGRRRMTNLLVEGGGQLLGSLFDAGQIDEVHVFIAPRIVGNHTHSPLRGKGFELIADALSLDAPRIENTGGDVYISGRVAPHV